MAEFKDRLKHAMKNADLNQTELSKITNIRQSSISDWLKGKYLAKQDKVELLARVLNVSPTWLMGLDATEAEPLPPNCFPIEKKKFPLLGNIACGEPIFANEGFEGYVEAGADIDADFCLRASGDSMIGARIHDGDIVFIKQQPIVDNGQIAAVLIENEATLKRFYYDQASDTVQLMAENPSYAPIVKMKSDLNDIRILGRAIAFQSIIK